MSTVTSSTGYIYKPYVITPKEVAKQEDRDNNPYPSRIRRVYGNEKTVQVGIPIKFCEQLGLSPGNYVHITYFRNERAILLTKVED